MQWLVTTPIGRGLLGVLGSLVVFGPALVLGVAWGAAVTFGFVGFGLGWAAARRYWRRNGYVPRL